MQKRGFALVGLLLAAAAPALAQPQPEQSPDPQPGQEQAMAPSSSSFNALLTAIGRARDTGQSIQALGPLPDSKVELRDAYNIEQRPGDPERLQSALNDNRQGLQELRRDLISNKSVDLALARDQVPIDHVVAAEVQPDGKVVVYAFPQSRVPPG